MTINTFENETKYFKELSVGDTFMYENCLHVKVEEFQYKNLNKANAFDFNNNTTCLIGEYSMVDPVDVTIEVRDIKVQSSFRTENGEVEE